MSQAAPSCIQISADAPADKDEITAEGEAVRKEATDVQRVLKEVGFTSATFIGPAFPPEKNIDDSLSDFYKEIQAIDDQVEKERATCIQLETSSTSRRPEKLLGDDDIRRAAVKHPSWPHWHKNKPYSTHGASLRYRPDYYPPPAFHPTPSHRASRGFRLPSFPYPHCSPPPRHGNPAAADWYPATSRPFWGTPRYDHGNPGNGDGGAHDPGWLCDAPQCHSEQDESQQQRCYDNFDRTSPLVLVLMRGLPGSGKTTMARELLATAPSGLILSTDDYFAHNGGYRYQAGLLGDAHEWNHRRACAAMRDGRSPVIIDNTNLQAWEMKPYVQMALQQGYRVDFCEPDTSWKYDPYELEKRNKHGVPQEKIAQMLDRFWSPISVDAVLSSQEPQHVHQRRQAEWREGGASFR
ncbi:NEDD4-binding protein 2-like 2 isoform X1 [Hippocampus zosterae]|uniref:NEDD4-binding protein 2-like 2 isoform X1 n=1 Tax=Hippocampus zosterae TaxID=109293 RepID=UPI00223D4278|nr:NEDD4-binding protein 2-like 2 isoform X1 [Hippocampus zosterae]